MIPKYGPFDVQMCFDDDTVSLEDREIAKSYCEKTEDHRCFTYLKEVRELESKRYPYYILFLGSERRDILKQNRFISFQGIVKKDEVGKEFYNYWSNISLPVLVLFTSTYSPIGGISENSVGVKELILFEDFKKDYKSLYKID